MFVTDAPAEKGIVIGNLRVLVVRLTKTKAKLGIEPLPGASFAKSVLPDGTLCLTPIERQE